MASATDAKRRQFARFKSQEFGRFLQEIAEGTNDYNIKRYLVPLFFKIYELHLEGRYINKSQACRFIPLKHSVSCQKYMDEAKARGYIHYEQDESDKRNRLIKPGTALIEFVERELDETIDATYAIVDQVEQEIAARRPR